MFRPEMLLPMGLPDGVNVIGFGLSLERPTMIKYKIDNIRDLVGHKVELLSDVGQKHRSCYFYIRMKIGGKVWILLPLNILKLAATPPRSL